MDELITYDKLVEYCQKVINELNLEIEKPDLIYGIARGGVIPAIIVSKILDVKMIPLMRKKQLMLGSPAMAENCKKILIVDDQNQTGESLQLTLEDITNLYPVGTQIQTALILFLRTGKFAVDYFCIEGSDQDEIKFPWDWDSPPSESPIIKEALSEYEKIKKKFKELDFSAKYPQLDQYLEDLIFEIQDHILKMESPVFYKLKGMIRGSPNIEDFRRKIEDPKVEIINPTSLNEYARMDIIVDTYKDCIFRLKLRETGSIIQFELDTSKNHVSRCEEEREDPHLICKACKLSDYDDLKNVVCFSFLNGLISLLKLEQISNNRILLNEIESVPII